MNRAVFILLAVVVLVAAFWLLSPRSDAKPPRQVEVVRADLVDRLVCRGEFAPHDGHQVRVPFSGRLQFIVEDGGWVEEGVDLFAISEDDAVTEAAEARSQLLAARQDLRLVLLRQRSTIDQQDRAVAKAERTLAIEELRLRIETSKPEGGDALIRLDAELQPLEERSRAAREQADESQFAWQKAQDAYLEAVDARSATRDRLLRLDARRDELRAAAERDIAGLQAHELDARTKAAEELVAVQAEHADLAEALPGLARKVAETRDARDALVAGRDRDAAVLEAAEAAEEDLRIRIEIEKRNLTATQLALDLAGARLALDQAQAEAARAEAAFAAGALAQVKLDEAREKLARSDSQVAILSARLAIAGRGPTEERLTELSARIERARTRAEAARSDRDRALAIAEQEVRLAQAKVTRLTNDVEKRSAAFPEVLESTIAFLDKEIAALDLEDPDDAARLEEATKERATLAERLVQARARPANVILAPVSGVVRLQRQDGRPKQAGDQVWEQDILVEIYPPGAMAVKVRVNEVDIAKLAVGMAAEITAPALPDYRSVGTVTRLSALGRDKLEGTGQVAGVVLFDGEIAVAEVREGMRQGMTALVTVAVATRADALHLPLEGVRRAGEGWVATVLKGGNAEDRPVVGAPFGDRFFVVESGLAEGDIVRVGGLP